MQTPKEKRLKYLYNEIDKLWHGVTNTKNGDYPTIAKMLNEIIDLNPKDVDSWENLVWLLWSMSINENDYSYLSNAQNLVKKYVSKHGNSYRAYEYAGQFYRVMYGDEKLAIYYYESAIRFKDAKITTYHSLISLFKKNNDKIRAIGYCKQCLNKFPNDPYTKSKLEELTK